MSIGRQRERSDLFLVRLWADGSGAGGMEWRGKVQRAVSGEAHYFHDWPEMVELLLAMLPPNQRQAVRATQQPEERAPLQEVQISATHEE